MRYSHALYTSVPLVGTFKVGATVVQGQPVRWVAGGAGTVTDPASVTSCPDCYGVTTEAGTYSTTIGAEGTVEVVYDPFAIFKCRVVPSATASTAYADGDGYFLTADSASAAGTTVADTACGGTTNDMIDGFLFCLSGNNARQVRVITAHTQVVSVVVTVPFGHASGIAAGDTFLASQYAPGVIAVQLTTDFTQANGTIAGATGAEFCVVGASVDVEEKGTKTAPILEIDIQSYDHAFNKA